ncbi:MAG: ferrochelatase, partial [Candidatus Korobacteraceae bacterium]
MSKQAVLLIAHGSPEQVEDIPEFLQNISRGRPMSDAVVHEVQHRYSLIGVSPLTCMTVGQANGVARELGIAAYVGMRNWHPFIADTLKQMTADGVEQAVAICLAPHNSRTSVGLYKQVLLGAGAPFTIDFVEEWHDHPLLIEAFADRLR